ncbi:MAG: hypothetical protein WCC28_19230 [Mycobacterium sp.]|uniref:hypothetical protein n=1 Tax=Mycobacterium sp. TaxID=1785 RepID=UPI003C7927C4
MSVRDESTASRQFVASAEAFSTGWIKGTKIWQAVYSVFFVAFVAFAALAMFRTSKGIPVHVPRYSGLIFIAVLLAAGVVIGCYLYWRSRQKYVLTVNGDALTVGPRGDVYSLADAQLGLWPNIGVALQTPRTEELPWRNGQHTCPHRPHWFQEVLTAVEFIVPAAFFGLADADETQSSKMAS